MILTLALALSGCERSFFEFMDWLSGARSNTLILAKSDTTLNKTPTQFSVGEKAKVIGVNTRVCLSLRGNFPLRSTPQMDAEYEKLLGNAKIKSTVTASSGKTFVFSKYAQTWEKYGIVMQNDEMSLCMSGTAPIPAKTAITKISVESDRQIVVKGVYWESSNG